MAVCDTMLQLDVARLKRSPGESVSFELVADMPPMEMAGEKISFDGPVKAVLNATNTGQTIMVEGTASGLLQLNCSRCLEPFRYSFEVPFSEIYTTAVEEAKEEEVIPFSGDEIDVTPEVLKCLIMSLPMKAVCNEECQGLCPGCGQNLNQGRCGCAGAEVDPRLSVLRDIFKGMNE
ncbi:hypothetical protein Psch_02564 [Pelotomaculum schinkii]|uniref:Large ribosomal RNA subunit accumulation protein YceD n=3 Tax=Pelotomaculum TaxID=191373 RepID=A0A4Y7RA06_9FIRM|nr:hypothetical protein Psch_02564 [Pelotomaculum schinkii]TEB14524.1 hypothetical protein Psfp_02863 [Pelotomaculum sp. FP]